MTSLQLCKNNFNTPPLHTKETYFIKVPLKINVVTMNMLRGPGETDLDADQQTGSGQILSSQRRSEVNVMVFGVVEKKLIFLTNEKKVKFLF